MSSASKISLAATSLFTAGVIVFVHFQQKADQAVRLSSSSLLLLLSPHPSNLPHTSQCSANKKKQAMHAGVVRDMEQQRVKRERQLDFDMQRALEEEYKREQNVHSSLEPLDKASNTPTR